ncbi:8216_t:CDS:2 [Funneliformis geosporum]|uniref:8216_t:CDS:1 n=1 Tax=Funneliformis geosporum TaxID=1117311 RepID=A0A9W4SIB3_9GLOM|nr:8216_t:CDS:2 [Funneliformis geosporum]
MTCKTYKSFNPCFVFILSYLLFRVESFTPVGRFAQSSVLVENKLYFFGGFNGESCSNEVFYLDVSQKFDSEFPLWTDLTLNSGIGFKSCWSTTVLTNNDNNPTIYLIGGLMLNQKNEEAFTSLVYSFNPKSGQWNMPIIKGNMLESHRNFEAIADDSGNIYCFGGILANLIGNIKFYDNMIILNTRDLTWTYSSVVNAPPNRDIYTATLLLDGRIVYIGGREMTNNELDVDINQINIYDTKLNVWSTINIAVALAILLM